MSNREIFLTAWRIARDGASRFGGKARDYFAQALTWAYQQLRSQRMNTFLIAEETERRANQCLQVAQVCLIMVVGIVGLLAPVLALYGLVGLFTMGALGIALIIVAGFAIRRCDQLDAGQC